MIDGMINVYKEKGFTSHDVVAKLRGILKQKKIGHTGTLDPDATGVLPVCLGKATKLCDMIAEKDKIYKACLRLGVATDTQDTSGIVLEQNSVSIELLELSKISEAIYSFIGDYDQLPPMYSALKVNGKKLYELAREGKEVERKTRQVHIFDIKIESINNNEACKTVDVVMDVHCSKGTYIRTLCHDIGEKLGCGGCMASLERLKVGRFDVKTALTLSQIEMLVKEDNVLEHVVAVDAMLLEYPAIVIKEAFTGLIHNGNPFKSHNIETEGFFTEDGRWLRVYDSTGEFVGIYAFSSEKHIFKPVKMFL